MKQADFNTQPNGFPLEADATLGFMQETYTDALTGIGKFFGEMVIISGMAEAAGNVADGWIMLNGELLFFEGGAKTATFIIEETIVQKANENAALVDRYFTRKAKFGTGGTQYDFDDLQRLEGLQNLQNRILDALVYFEAEVALSGLVVSSVNTGLSTLAISAGVAVINRTFVSAPAYSGGYPVYLKLDGTWTNTAPASNFIAFNPYTSQRLADVTARATSPIGDVRMRAALSTSFDVTGLGKWELKGWALCNGANGTFDLRSRFPVAYDGRIADPGGNIWDVLNNTPGSTGGEKVHTLSISEMPAHRHTADTIAEGALGMARRTVTGDDATADNFDASSSGTEPDIKNAPQPMATAGGGQAHENRPPFKVLVFIQRI
jgi:hypothetical protein